MTKSRGADKTAKLIEVTFTSYDFVPNQGEVPLLNALNAVESPAFPLLVHHQTEEFDRVYREIERRIEGYFHDYGVARTGDDLCDFRNLALQMAIERFPDLGLTDNPALLECLFPFFKVVIGENGVDALAYRLLVLQMAERQGILSVERQQYERKPSNPLALLQLLADAEAINSKRQQLPCSDRQITAQLIEKEPRWGDMSQKTLQHWLTVAREVFKRPEGASEYPEE